LLFLFVENPQMEVKSFQWLFLTLVIVLFQPTLGQPTQSNYKSLNQTLQGKLSAGIPLAEPCYSNYNGQRVTPNPSLCSTIEANYTNETFIAANFGGYENTNWGICQINGQGCNLDFLSPSTPNASSICYQGSVPNYYIPVTNVSDVQAALSYADKTGVPLVIKNSGHDFKGRSSAPNSLALWTKTYRPPITLTQNFVPAGCPSSVGKLFSAA
jgi:hypothetical protein